MNSKTETRLKTDRTHIIVNRSYYHSTNHQEPISHGDIYLAMKVFAGMNHFNMWEVAHPHDLREELEAARDHCLGGNNRRQYCYYERWVKHSRGYSIEERVRVCSFCGVMANVGSLPNVS